ncbi:hypothetical protein Dda_5678 [Drechslerella dactyloides]|uniref:Protein kinase domain-containing protein n=1 Tax=Drechslerella dactyloides TaxID=74499 RepID=A0AAD6NJ36_DREDA|nr:hypothetical protein Dda_5678 [Drechslerella dactyloides]
MSPSQENNYSGFWYDVRRQLRTLFEAAFEWRNKIKEVDFSGTKCDPHPFPHPDSDRLEHCYKYGYGKGKFYPVQLGQRLGSYHIKAKLGHGNFATVWQAEPIKGLCTSGHQSVAIKVCSNNKKDNKDDVLEAKVLRKLGKRSDGKGDFGKDHLMTVDECFNVPGHFGDHFCIVSESIGPTLDHYLLMVEKQNLGSFDYNVAKKVTFQLLSAVTWLHAAGYGHGDIHPYNVLMKEQGYQAPKNAKRNVCYANCKPEDKPYMPPYLVSCIDDDLAVGAPLSFETCDARLADFGQSFKKNHPRRLYRMTTQKGLRSPEWVIKHAPITISIDIWSIACMAYRMVTGKRLMDIQERYIDENGQPTQKRTKFDINNEHLPMMVELFGTPPPWIRGKWAASNLPPINWKSTSPEGTLHKRIQDDCPSSMSTEEAELFEDFLRKAFVWDYRFRATAKDLIQHKWFQSILTDADKASIEAILVPSRFEGLNTIRNQYARLRSLPVKIGGLFAQKVD